MITRDNSIIKQILLHKQNNRTFTLKSLRTGRYISFRVNRGFVSYIKKHSKGKTEYPIGKIQKGRFIYSNQIELSFQMFIESFNEKEIAIKAFEFLFKNIMENNINIHNKINFMLDDRCRKCHKQLTNSISLIRGYGEKCNFLKN